LTSTTGKIGAVTNSGTLKITTATAKDLLDAKSVAGDVSVGTFTAAKAVLVSGTDMTVSSGTPGGELSAKAGRNASLGNLTSTADKVLAEATGSLTITTAKASAEVDLTGAGLTATTLTSTNAFVDVDSSLAGSVNVKTANAKTYFNAKSYGAMTIGTFGVTAGYAKLFSRAAMGITTGASSGYMDIDGGTNVALGNLTSTGGFIDAQSSGGGMTFGTLRANSYAYLRADKAWTNGQAISGTALYASNGYLDVLANSGGITVGTLSATTPSSVITNSGSIKISTVLGLTKPNLTITPTGGTKTVPLAFR